MSRKNRESDEHPVDDFQSPPRVDHIFSEPDNGKNVTLRLHECITIRLPENPSTGYRWQFLVSDGIELEKDSFSRTSSLIGAGGTRIWEGRVTKTGTRTISGIYKRSWETTSVHEKEFRISFDVIP